MFVTAWYVIGVIFWRKMTFESMWLQYRQNLGCRLIRYLDWCHLPYTWCSKSYNNTTYCIRWMVDDTNQDTVWDGNRDSVYTAATSITFLIVLDGKEGKCCSRRQNAPSVESVESDLRRISLTPTICRPKVLESFVGRRMLATYHTKQFGALRGRSTTHALVDILLCGTKLLINASLWELFL